jgi:hypothetical protein
MPDSSEAKWPPVRVDRLQFAYGGKRIFTNAMNLLGPPDFVYDGLRKGFPVLRSWKVPTAWMETYLGGTPVFSKEGEKWAHPLWPTDPSNWRLIMTGVAGFEGDNRDSYAPRAFLSREAYPQFFPLLVWNPETLTYGVDPTVAGGYRPPLPKEGTLYLSPLSGKRKEVITLEDIDAWNTHALDNRIPDYSDYLLSACALPPT